MKVKLFTHTDLDGVGCAIIAFLSFGKGNVDVEYCNYHDINDAVVNYFSTNDGVLHDRIFITDISVNKKVADILDQYYQNGVNIRLFDHHDTAMWLNDYHWAYVLDRHHLDKKKASGTSLFYQYLLSKDPNLEVADDFVELVRLYDTWEWTIVKDERPNDLNSLLTIYGRGRFVNQMIQRFKSLSFGKPFYFTEQDSLLLQLHKEKIQNYVKHKEKSMHVLDIFDYKAGVVFAEQFINDVAHHLHDLHPELDFIAVVNPYYESISFRTNREDIDVSKIASELGGGGKPQTAGAELSKEDIESLLMHAFALKMFED
jgi:uncharacterized protein